MPPLRILRAAHERAEHEPAQAGADENVADAGDVGQDRDGQRDDVARSGRRGGRTRAPNSSGSSMWKAELSSSRPSPAAASDGPQTGIQPPLTTIARPLLRRPRSRPACRGGCGWATAPATSSANAPAYSGSRRVVGDLDAVGDGDLGADAQRRAARKISPTQRRRTSISRPIFPPTSRPGDQPDERGR